MKDKYTRKLKALTSKELSEFFFTYDYNKRDIYTVLTFKELLVDKIQFLTADLFDREIKIIRNEGNLTNWNRYYHRKRIIKLLEEAIETYLQMNPYVLDGIVNSIHSTWELLVKESGRSDHSVSEYILAITESLSVPYEVCNTEEMRALLSSWVGSPPSDSPLTETSKGCA